MVQRTDIQLCDIKLRDTRDSMASISRFVSCLVTINLAGGVDGHTKAILRRWEGPFAA